MKLSREQLEAARGAFNPERYYRYMDCLTWSEYLWSVASGKPIKFPAPSRRRRSDREIPKAA
jgi:hypothetical protein